MTLTFLPDTRRFLRRQAASEYLEHTYGIRARPKTLAKLASIGGGPPFRYVGRFPVYSPAELDGWAAERLTGPFHSTSQRTAASPNHATVEVPPAAQKGEADRGRERKRG